MSALQDTQQKHLLQVLKNQKLTDVTFIIGSDKKQFRVNRIFLAVISPVFEAMLCGNMKESKPNSNVIIPDIDADAFECITKFAYFNDPGITAQNISNVKYICDKYQIEILSQHLPETLRSILDCSNFLISLHGAVQLKHESLIKQCTDYLKSLQTQHLISAGNRWNIHDEITSCSYPRREFVSKIIKSDSFLNLALEGMKILLTLDEFAVKEDIIWEQLIKWSDHQTQKVMDDQKQSDKADEYKLSLLKSVKPYVRFGLMSPQCFARSVQPQNVLDAQEMIDVFTYLCGNKTKGCGQFCIKPRDGV
eukprot:94802_1